MTKDRLHAMLSSTSYMWHHKELTDKEALSQIRWTRAFYAVANRKFWVN